MSEHPKEIKISLSNEEQKYSRDFLVYDNTICLSPDDPVLKGMVDQTTAEFTGVVQDCVIKIKMTV